MAIYTDEEQNGTVDVEQQKENFKLDISDCFNNNKSFEMIKDAAITHLDIHLDNDDDVWHRIEDAILETIIEFSEEVGQ